MAYLNRIDAPAAASYTPMHIHTLFRTCQLELILIMAFGAS
ncbi:hypothetical protein TSAR_015724 [Trichomalopsis sarcophagae]|uniref:Uncharacterized protein n=1 Tax=Trichomalopsis sarcophagae TaxID=543379 RepID=A0A232EQ67_9HYME|nr:hypothetical protein TSAR_015724 [Trichomalopsis sarcophagae]